MMVALLAGLTLTGVVTALLGLAVGESGILPGAVFGGLATGIQAVSAFLMRHARRLEFPALMKRWAVGMGLRLGGIAGFGVAAWAWPQHFPPLPTACAYLGVVVPLLFLEIRFLR